MSGVLVQYECLVESLCFPYRSEDMVLCSSGSVDAVDFVCDGSLPDGEDYRRQTGTVIAV